MMKGIKKLFTRAMSFVSAMVMAAAMGASLPTNAAENTSEENMDHLVMEIAVLVNEARVEAGLKPLYILPSLNDTAELRAYESSESFSHTRTDGRSFSSAIEIDEFYSVACENLAAGNSSAERTFNQWKNSPGHWANIMNPNTTHMGIGVVYEADSEYKWYWQQTFIGTNAEFSDQYLPYFEEIVPKAKGDVNGDGVVDIYDYVLLTDYIRKKKTDYPVYFNEAQIEAADCFQDGFITESDAKAISRYILGEYKSLPFVF